MEFPGIIEHYASFTDAQKWAFNMHLSRVDQPATQNAVWRAFAFPTFAFRCSSPWESVAWRGDEIVVRTPRGEERYDFVIAATGISVDLSQRTELADFVDDIALWRHRMPPDTVDAMPGLGNYPYLDDVFGLRSIDGRRDAPLSRIHMFNHGARLSAGVLSHQISGLYGGVHRLVRGIVGNIFRERSAELLREYLAYDTPAGIAIGPRHTVDAVAAGAEVGRA
jgi:cation diffusion facilitator CzcD-associated flavoprotein CzcO